MFRKTAPRSRVLLGLFLVLTMMAIVGCGTDLQPTGPTGIQQTAAPRTSDTMGRVSTMSPAR